MRGISAFASMNGSDLESIADSGCDLTATVTRLGGTNEDAIDKFYDTLQDQGLTDADALLASLTIVGTHCPMDIRK